MAASMSVSPVELVVAGQICLDVIPVLHGPAKIEPGRLMEIGPAELSTGGAVPNTGLPLHQLGVAVRLMGKIGDDLFGGAVLEALQGRDPELAGSMVVAAGVRPPATRLSSARPAWTGASCIAPAPTTPSRQTISAMTS